MKTVAIVPAAGAGKRLKTRVRKPFVLLRGRPLITYALSVLDASPAIDQIVVAVERPLIEPFKRLVKRFNFGKITDVVAGGRTRRESVSNCLAAVDPACGIVLIHDGARPFIERSLIDRSIKLARRYGGCIVAVPESDTVKLVGRDLFVKKTLERERIMRAQTPQAFRYDLIRKAYRSAPARGSVTDDASLVEMLGGRVKILKGSYRNIKITTPEDIKIAEALL